MKQKNKSSFPDNQTPYSINYIYYGIYFVLFAGLQIFHVVLLSSPDTDRVLYSLYAGAESFIEVLGMAVISSWLLRRRLHRLHSIWILIPGILLFCRVMDFLLVRLMDISVWHGLTFFLREGISNILELLVATTISPKVWVLSFLLCALFIVGCRFLFGLSYKTVRKLPLYCSAKTLCGIFALAFSFLVADDLLLRFFSSASSDASYEKALPWKRTLFPEDRIAFSLPGYLPSEPPDGMLREADSSVFAPERNPDIFLFVTETVREDFLSETVTPALTRFSQESGRFSQSLSISNGTPTSWFSIFYSVYPFYWNRYKDLSNPKGSPALALLRKMGYEIRVYSGSRINYYSMRNVLFGKDGKEVDALFEFQTDPNTPPHEADAKAMNQLRKDLVSERKGGRLFIVFLDSTHFDYSWPEKTHTVFSPIEPSVNYLSISYRRDNLEKIANRYKNALHYLDDLFGVFRSDAERLGLWDSSLVIFTADHGEELNEKGCMFHASHLSLPQLQIPLYIKLAKEENPPMLRLDNKASQIDIFPSILHYISGEEIAGSPFQGKSLFLPPSSSYLVGARYNGCLTPYQFYLQNGEYRMIAEFANESDIFHCNTLHILAVENELGESLPFSEAFLRSHFQEGIDALFSTNR